MVFYAEGTHAFKFSAVLPICGMRESDIRVVILGFLLAGLGTVHSFAQTTHDPDIESKIVALENVALVYVEYGQLVTKGDYLARIKQESPQIAMEAMTVRQFGDTAIVVGTYRERQSRGGHPRGKALAIRRHLGTQE